jgi:hypothetical protein
LPIGETSGGYRALGLVAGKEDNMKLFIGLVLWCLLLVVCWPVAMLALLAFPILWLLSLPLRLIVYCVHGLLSFMKGLFLLPARLLGHRRAEQA